MAERRALQQSIAHWTRFTNGKAKDDEQISCDDCALCKKFYHSSECNGCPVYRFTKDHECRGTPWKQAHSAWLDANYDRDDAKFKKAAGKMLAFLKKVQTAVRKGTI